MSRASTATRNSSQALVSVASSLPIQLLPGRPVGNVEDTVVG